VMRQKHRITVNGKMPAEDRRWRTFRNSLEIPAMPEMPAMPMMPARPGHLTHPDVVRIVMEQEA
jgi:hypothetical protein